MPSMDTTYEEMRAFYQELKKFNQLLAQTCREMESKHQDLYAAWSVDSYRKQYDQKWDPLQKQIKQYQTKSAPRYHRFLENKLKALQRFLGRD